MLGAWKSIAVMTVTALVMSLVAVALPPAKPVQASPNWLDGWRYQIKLTIDCDDVTDDLYDFPVLVYLSASSGTGSDDVTCVFNELGCEAKRIAVTESNGTSQCYVEIEKWDLDSVTPGNSEAWLWVRVPNVSSSEDTVLYLYYDYSHTDNTDYVDYTNETAAENVWVSSFKCVYHMADGAGTSAIYDSTSNDNDGTKMAAAEPAVTTSGKIADAQVFDGGDDKVYLADPSDYNSVIFAFSAWVKMDGDGSGHDTAFGVGDKDTDNDRLYMRLGGGSTTLLTDESMMMARKSGGTLTHVAGVQNGASALYDGGWHHIGLVADTEYAFYLDGVKQTTTAATGSNGGSWGAISNVNQAELGRIVNNVNTADFDGVMDEVQIADANRSDAWMKATYDSGRDALIEYDATGTITVCKHTIPFYDDGQDFHFTSNIPGYASFYLDDDADGTLSDCTSEIPLPAGVYNITEDDPSPGWDLTDLQIMGEPLEGTLSVLDVDNRTVQVYLDPGEKPTVTFVNTEWGTIVVYKDVVSVQTETDDFDFTGDLGSFTLDDDGVGDNYEWFQKAPGTYDVTELVPTGWDLTDITIVDPSTDSSSDLEAGTASLDLSLNEAITCHFENTKRGNIIVEKHTRGGPDGSFTFTGDVAGSIGDGGNLEEEDLVPGKYTVRERIPTGWELSSIRCDDDNSSGSTGTGTTTINLEPGETVTCTYTNSYLGGTPGLPRKVPGAVGTPEPASVLACYLDVPVTEAMPGQQFDISVNLCNRGGEKATKSVDLLINGYQEQSQTVGLGPGACQTVVFRVFKTVPGTYEVSVMGQVGYFTIMPLYPGYVVTQAPAQQAGGIGTAGIITIVVVVIVLAVGLVLILRR